MLAQGSFDAFLKAKEKDRSALLEKITGTKIYSEISKLTYSKYSQFKQDVEKEKKAEEKRAGEFEEKFGFLKRFDFSYGIKKFWNDKRFFMLVLAVVFCPFVFLGRLPYVFVRWAYKEGWWYSLGLVAIVVWLGIYPKPVLQPIDTSVKALVSFMHEKAQTPEAKERITLSNTIKEAK